MQEQARSDPRHGQLKEIARAHDQENAGEGCTKQRREASLPLLSVEVGRGVANDDPSYERHTKRFAVVIEEPNMIMSCSPAAMANHFPSTGLTS